MSTTLLDEQIEIAERFLGAWNTHDVDQVLACYTEDLRYRDPNTRGDVLGAAAMRRYLTRLFGAWRMRWELRELHPHGEDGSTVLWRATLSPVGSDQSVEIEGMDLVRLRDGRVSVNEVVFDRALLAPLLT